MSNRTSRVRQGRGFSGGSINWLNAAFMMTGITAVVITVSEGGDWDGPRAGR